MRARDRQQFADAWHAHVTGLGQLAEQAGVEAAHEWAQIQPRLRTWIRVAAERAFPEPTAAGDLPNHKPNGGAT